MSIIFAELYGQKNYEKLRKESFLSLSAGGSFTIVLSIVSLLVLYPVMGLIHTPPEAEPYVVAYIIHNKTLLSVNGQVLTVNCVCIFRVQQL